VSEMERERSYAFGRVYAFSRVETDSRFSHVRYATTILAVILHGRACTRANIPAVARGARMPTAMIFDAMK